MPSSERDTTSTTSLGLEARPNHLARLCSPHAHIKASLGPGLGLAGGVPARRRQYRTRPPTAPPPCLFDVTTDWASAYAAHTGAAHHSEDHFVELYALEVLRLMPQHSGAGALPSDERGWKDVKLHGGARGEFRHIYAAALRASQARATADSIRASEQACMVARGARGVSED